MFPETVETASTDLRQLSDEYVDVFDLYDCFAADREGSGDVFEYVPQEPFETVKDAHDWLRDAPAEWNAGESAKYAVYVGDDADDGDARDDLAGVAALSFDWDRRTANLAVILARPYWGRGYAGECAMTLLPLAFDRLDLDLVELSYDGDNERSKRAIESLVDRLGGRFDGTLRNWTVLGDAVVDNHRYTVSQAEYRQSDAGG